jgi:geranylgeranyl diphosphate synthase type I
MTFPQPLLDHEGTVDRALRKLFEEPRAAALPLYRMMQYQLGWVSTDGTPEVGPLPERLHGALAVEAAGNDDELVATVGAAAELLYQSVRIHEQMQTSEGPGEGRSAVWWVWGPAQAINVGDGLHALARLSAFRLQGLGLAADRTLEVVAGLDRAALRYYEGQYLDLTYQERIDVTEAQYEGMVLAKRGALLGGALAAGAYVAGANQVTADALRSFGECLGLATQVREDITELWPREGVRPSGRVLNKSKLLPVVYALERAEVRGKRALGAVYFKRVMEPDDVEAVRKVLDDLGARDYAEAKAADLAAKALGHIEGAGLSDAALDRWRQVVDALAEG